MRQPIAQRSRLTGLVRLACLSSVRSTPRRRRPTCRCAAPPCFASSRPRHGWHTGRACRHPARAARPGRRHLAVRSKYHCSLTAPLCHLVPDRSSVADPRSYAAPMQLTVRTDRLVAGGDAMGRADDGRVVFVTGALPGELVEVDIVETKKDFVRVAGAAWSSNRRPTVRVPVCAASPCGLRRLRLDAPRTRRRSSRAKAEIVRESLRRIGRLDAAVVDDLVRGRWRGRPVRISHHDPRRRRPRRHARLPRGAQRSCRADHELSDRRIGAVAAAVGRSSSTRVPRSRCGRASRPAQITAIWSREHRHGVRGVPSRGAHRRARLVDANGSPASTCGCRRARSSNPGRRAPSCSSTPSAGGAGTGHRCATPSMPTAASACSPSR